MRRIDQRDRLDSFAAILFLVSVAALATACNDGDVITTEQASQQTVDVGAGEHLYQRHCAECHEGQVPKAPHRDWLAKMAPDSVIRSMNQGVMQKNAEGLSQAEREEVTRHLTGIHPDDYVVPPGAEPCEGVAAQFDLQRPPSESGWGYDTSRFVPAESAGLTRSDVPNLRLRWAFAYPGAVRARSFPVIAMGAVFVGSQDGTVYSFDLETGCTRWTTRLSAEVRTAAVVEPWPNGEFPDKSPRVFLGDLMGRVHALDATTGEVLWSARPDDHPNATITGTPVIHDGVLYVPVSSLEVLTAIDTSYECCTFRGSVTAMNPDDGSIVWKHYTVPDPAVVQGRSKVGTIQKGPSGAAVWGSPAVDVERGVLYFGSSENYSTPADENSDAIFAVDLETGKRIWRQQLLAGDAWNASCYFGAAEHPNCPRERGPDYDFSASPVLVETADGGQLVVAGQKSGMVFGLDPDDDGALVWDARVGHGGVQGGVHFGMTAELDRIFVPINDIPLDAEGQPIEADTYPGLHGLDATTGEILWRSVNEDNCNNRKYCDPGISAAASSIAGVVFAGHLDGMLRAYDSNNGAVLWEVDTAAEFEATNGVATGGSIGGPGPAIGSGAVVVNSGYDFGDHMPGNALLVFAADDLSLDNRPDGHN